MKGYNLTVNQIAIAAIKRQIKKIAFDANLYDRKWADYPHAKNCSEKRKELLKAIKELEGYHQGSLKL